MRTRRRDAAAPNGALAPRRDCRAHCLRVRACTSPATLAAPVVGTPGMASRSGVRVPCGG